MGDNTIAAQGSGREGGYVWLVRGNGSMMKTTKEVAGRLARGPVGYRLATEEEVNRKLQSYTPATDAARREAGQREVDLTQVRGTGSGGQITVEDVKKAAGQEDS